MNIKKPETAVRILQEAKHYWPHLLFFFVLTLASIPLTLLTPVPVKLVVDHVLGHAPISNLSRWIFARLGLSVLVASCGLALTLTFLQSALTLGTWIYQRNLGEKLVLSARERALAHIQSLSLAQHQGRGTPDLLYRLQNDIANMQYFPISTVVPFFTAVITFVIMLIVTLRLDCQLATLAMLCLPILWFLSRTHVGRSLRRWKTVKESERDAIGVLQETINCIQVIKAFGQEQRQVHKFSAQSNLNLQNYLTAICSDGGFSLTIAGVLAIATAGFLYIGVIHIQTGQLSLGNFLLLMAYLAQLLKSAENFSRQVTTSQNALASAKRVYELLDQKPAIEQRAPFIALPRAKGRIEFREVSFAHLNGQTTLHGISFQVDAGRTVGVFGTSGAGKTTLINLLARLHEPTEGIILLDGVDLRHIRSEHLRTQFALVPQEPLLFAGSIADNIAYARPGASFEEIVRAATDAEAHEFIMQMKDNYQAEVGERGSALSGGERQRISIARAFLANAPVLILDEPLSALDELTGQLVDKAISKLRKNRTTFIISHRDSLLTKADFVLEIKAGKLVSWRQCENENIQNS